MSLNKAAGDQYLKKKYMTGVVGFAVYGPDSSAKADLNVAGIKL
jgi:hypothetical protein